MALPSGTITFLFSDIAGSTPLWEQVPHAMARALQIHDAIVRDSIEVQGGHVFKTVGDAFHAAFERAENAVLAAILAQKTLLATDWGEIDQLPVRMALHTGSADLRNEDYFGPTVNRTARVLGLAHPGQVLVSHAAAQLLAEHHNPDVSLLDLGEFELRGMSRREKIYQLVHPGLEFEFPLLRPATVAPTNLPPQLSTFIGRDRELAEVLSALRKSRLVTLTGSGGSGKTRLSIEAAAECITSFPDGAWIAELASIAEGHLVNRSVASALGVAEQAGRSELDTLCEGCRPKKLLLILDNCEHVLDASAEVIEAIIRTAPNVHVLATSREAIGISGEVVLRIPSMALPPPGATCKATDLDRFDGTKLFVERAIASDRNFAVTNENCETIIQICRRLDGIPLAIELAASRLRGMAVGQLAGGLDDRFRILTGGSRTAVSRQRTLRALIDWSYDILSDKERTLLRSLSVFTGGWTLEAAEAVGFTGNIEQSEILNLLSALVEKSLCSIEPLASGAGRYRLLETIRQYAADKLAEAGEAADARTRHMKFFESLSKPSNAWTANDPGATALSLSGHLTSTIQVDDSAFQKTYNRVIADWDNIRAAIEWGLETDVPTGLQIAVCLIGVYERFGRILEGSDIISRAITASQYLGDSHAGLLAHFCGARLAFRKADMEQAFVLAEKGIAIGTAINDLVGTALSKSIIANIYASRGDDEAAREAYLEVREVGIATQNAQLQARSTYGLMLLARGRADFLEFSSLLDEAETQFTEAGMTLWVRWTRSYRGSYAEETGDLAAAARVYREVLSEVGQAVGIEGIWHWECIARVATLASLPEPAAMLYGAAETHRKRMGWPVQPSERDRNDRARTAAELALEAAYQHKYAEGASLTYQEATDLGLSTAAKIAGLPP